MTNATYTSILHNLYFQKNNFKDPEERENSKEVMRHNLTLLEVGWLCPALLSLLRSSPQIHSDQNSQTLLRLLNESAECHWPTAATPAEAGDHNNPEMVQVLDRVLRGSNPTHNQQQQQQQQRLHAGKKLSHHIHELQLKQFSQQQHKLANGGEADEAEEEEEDDPRVIWGMTVVYMVISLLGIVGNILVVVVVQTVPGMKTPTNCYLVSLAISDCLFLSAAGPVELSYLHRDVNDYAFGAIGCKILTFLPYLGINTSSMSIMAFTVERFIGICHPLRARYICTVKRAKFIILFIWCFCILYNSPWLYLATLKEGPEGGECSFRLSRDNWTYKVVFVADFMTFYMLPMFLYIYIYGKITYTLSKCELKYSMNSASTTMAPTFSSSSNGVSNNNNSSSSNCHRNSRCDSRPDLSATFATSLSAPDSPPSPPNNAGKLANNLPQNGTAAGHNNIGGNGNCNGNRDFFVTIGNGSAAGPGRRSSANAKGKGRGSNMQVIKMLALVVFIFAVCWLPYRAMVMYNSFASALGWHSWNWDWFIYMSKTMIFFNCAINPILYNLMSGRFRQAFRRLLSGEKQYINSYKRDSVCMQTTTTTTNWRPLMGQNQQRKKGSGGGDLVLSRMAAADADVRATLLLKMHRNGKSRVEELEPASAISIGTAAVNGNGHIPAARNSIVSWDGKRRERLL